MSGKSLCPQTWGHRPQSPQESHCRRTHQKIKVSLFLTCYVVLAITYIFWPEEVQEKRERVTRQLFPRIPQVLSNSQQECQLGGPVCIFSQLLIRGHHVGRLKSSGVGVFTPQKLANTTNPSFFTGEPVVKHFPAHCFILHQNTEKVRLARLLGSMDLAC